jgi:hypothetical protein
VKHTESGSFIQFDNNSEDQRTKLRNFLQNAGLEALKKEEIWTTLIQDILTECNNCVCMGDSIGHFNGEMSDLQTFSLDPNTLNCVYEEDWIV